MKTLFYVSVAAWVLAVNINTVFVVRALIRHVRRRKDGASPWSLGLREKKLWYCVLLTLVLMERFAFVYMLVFQRDPAAAFSSKMMGQHGVAAAGDSCSRRRNRAGSGSRAGSCLREGLRARTSQ